MKTKERNVMGASVTKPVKRKGTHRYRLGARRSKWMMKATSSTSREQKQSFWGNETFPNREVA
ncbi:hypothetical protein AMJ80_09235 [bacterium SM23_31]|nr:MAG: hypothetical protein AMJ80_09235 [bacterium SM23_31]